MIPGGSQWYWQLTVKVFPENPNLAPTKVLCPSPEPPQLYWSPPHSKSHPLDLRSVQPDNINKNANPKIGIQELVAWQLLHSLMSFKSGQKNWWWLSGAYTKWMLTQNGCRDEITSEKATSDRYWKKGVKRCSKWWWWWWQNENGPVQSLVILSPAKNGCAWVEMNLNTTDTEMGAEKGAEAQQASHSVKVKSQVQSGRVFQKSC